MLSTSKIVFKDYTQKQTMLFPPNLEELIEPNHPVRTVDQVIDSIDIEPIIKQYKGGGTSSYHPRLLLKVLVYGYITNEYSSRKIEQAIKQNIHFMWLAGMSRPDHNTINRFRSDRLKDVLKQVFAQVVHLLVEAGHINIKEVYIDGTKIEANANRYTFVWGKSIKHNKEKIVEQLQALWNYAESIAKEELENNEPIDFKAIDTEKVKQTIEQIDTALAGKKVNKQIKQKLNYARKEWPKNLDKYTEQEKILADRNNYSKTDPDASFMRLKEDHMLNGQLKPAYNWQMSTQNQFIVNYSLHQNPTDTTTLPSHLNELIGNIGYKPEKAIADAGYGSEENYTELERLDIEPFVKFNYFHKEQTRKWKNDPFKVQNLYYNPQSDCYYCPMGQKMRFIGTKTNKSENSFLQTLHRYQAQNCQGCPLRGLCHKAKGNRIIEVNHKLNRYKEIVRQKLKSEEGLMHRSKRPVEVEAVFGMIKNNRHFRRFQLRGLKKVTIEIGLISLAHNLKKMTA